MPDLRPFRDYSTHEVVNLFAVSGSSVPKGTFVSVQGSGFNYDLAMSLTNLSPYAGTQSINFNVPYNVVPAASGALKTQVLGVLLKDRKTTDENGIPLIYFPKRAAELDAIVSGQAAPVLRRGLVLYSGIVGSPQAGSGAAIADAGDGSLKVINPTITTTYSGANTITYPDPTCIGTFLGPTGTNGMALLEFDLMA